MKLRELYSQETNSSVISKINTTVLDIGARLPGFGLRRLPIGILTVFWLFVWGAVVSIGTYITAQLLDIPLDVISMAWNALLTDMYAIVTTPIGIPTTIAVIYGFSIYLQHKYAKGFKQNYSDKSVNLQPLLLSVLLAGTGFYMFFIGISTSGFIVGLTGTVLSTHYTKKISVYDRKSTYNHYDMYYINGIVRSLTLWSIVYTFTGGISTLTIIPLVLSITYSIWFIIQRNYTETLMNVYDKDEFLQKFRDFPMFYRRFYYLLEDENTQNSPGREMNLDSSTTRKYSTDSSDTAEDTEGTYGITEEDRIRGNVDPVIDADPEIVNTFEQRFLEVLDSAEGTLIESNIEELDEFNAEVVYRMERDEFESVHELLLELDKNTKDNTEVANAVEDALRYSQEILTQSSVSQ